jgi:Armadillo/beta-catenin-like repeat
VVSLSRVRVVFIDYLGSMKVPAPFSFLRQVQVVNSGGVEALVELLRDSLTSFNGQFAAAAALYNVAANSEAARTLMVGAGVIRPLVTMLGSGALAWACDPAFFLLLCGVRFIVRPRHCFAQLWSQSCPADCLLRRGFAQV